MKRQHLQSNAFESIDTYSLFYPKGTPANFLRRLDELKMERGLIRSQRPLPSFTAYLPELTIQQYKTLGLRFVEGLSKLAYQILLGHPAFPSLQELGFSQSKIHFMQHNLPQNYKEMMVISRLDMSTDGTHFLTYECNGSQPGGLEYAAFFSHPLFTSLGGGESLQTLYHDYLHNSLAFYRNKTSRSEPQGILLLSNNYHLIHPLHAALELYLQRPVFLANNAASCLVEGKTFLFQDEHGRKHPIDLVMRSPRASLEALLERENAVLRKAWRQGNVVIVNPPHAKIVGWKTLYVYLQQEKLLDLAEVTDEQRDAIAQILPPIEVVTQASKDRYLEHKDQWVLKNTLRGRGTMVWLGPELSQAEWNKRIERASGQKGWICQQFEAPFQLPIHLHDLHHSCVTVPITLDPYVTLGDIDSVTGFLCRAVIPTHGDLAELRNVKLNLLGRNQYQATNGSTQERIIGFGHLASLP